MRAVILERENRPPGVANEMHFVVPEMRAKRVELGDKVGDSHLRRISESVRSTAAELIVSHNWSISVQLLERFHEVAAEARTAVQENRRRCSAGSGDTIPD